MPPKRGRGGVRGRCKDGSAAKLARSKPALGHCPCTNQIENELSHGKGKSTQLIGNDEPQPNVAFLILQVPRLAAYVEQHDLQQFSARTITINSEESKRLNAEIHKLNQETEAAAEQQKQAVYQQRVRAKAEAKFAAEAASNAVGFLTFRYGKSAEDRRGIYQNWAPEQVIGLASASHSVVSTAGSLKQEISWGAEPNGTGTGIPTTTFDGSSGIIARRTQQNRANPGQLKRASSYTPNSRVLIPGLDLQVFDTEESIQPPLSTGISVLSGQALSKRLVLDSEQTSTNMSEQPSVDTGGADEAVKDVIQNLFVLQQHVHGFRNEHQTTLNSQIDQLAQSLTALENTISRPHNPLHNVKVAPEIIDYVDDGRNPDIFTRDFVELVQRGNAVMNGKKKAFRDFSKIYAKALKDNFDNMDEEVDLIMGNAGMEERSGVFVEKVQNGNGV